jgi:hypothetical protein
VAISALNAFNRPIVMALMYIVQFHRKFADDLVGCAQIDVYCCSIASLRNKPDGTECSDSNPATIKVTNNNQALVN